MHNPHAGDDPKKEKDQDDYEESDGEGEDGGSPIAFVAGHVCVPSSVKVRNKCSSGSIPCMKCILEEEKRRAKASNEVLIIRLKLGSGGADLALLWEVRCLESALPSLPR